MSAVRYSKGKRWGASVGPYRARASLSQEDSGLISGKVSGGKWKSLGHRDKDAAIAWAKEQARRLAAGDRTLYDPTPFAARVFGLYLNHKTAKKVLAEQRADERRARMWLRFLGPRKDLSKLILREWDEFIEKRRSGAINASGEPVPEGKRVPVRDNTVAGDLVFLRGVINWACKWQDDDAHYLMRDNPTRGYPLPIEKNPRRPVATADRYEKVRAVAEQVTMAVGRGRHAPHKRSPLGAILDLAHHTGRRIGAILALRRDDLLLNPTCTMPFGAIRWRAETDKCGREWTVPMSREVRAVIDQLLVERPLIGGAYLFEAPNHPGTPIAKEVASAWLIKAEQLAGVEKQKGSLWHAYRRGWATARKHMPDVDVAAAGGWSDLSSLKQCYQHADEATMYRVVSEPGLLREVQGG